MDPDSNLTPPPIEFFVTGRAKVAKAWVILKFEKVHGGWLSIAVHGKAPELHNHYVSNEMRENLYEWFPCDFMNRTFTSSSLEEAKEYLARKTDERLYST